MYLYPTNMHREVPMLHVIPLIGRFFRILVIKNWKPYSCKQLKQIFHFLLHTYWVHRILYHCADRNVISIYLIRLFYAGTTCNNLGKWSPLFRFVKGWKYFIFYIFSNFSSTIKRNSMNKSPEGTTSHTRSIWGRLTSNRTGVGFLQLHF